MDKEKPVSLKNLSLDLVEEFARQIEQLEWIAEAYGLTPCRPERVEFDVSRRAYIVRRRYVVTGSRPGLETRGEIRSFSGVEPFDAIWNALAFAMRHGWIKREMAVMRAARGEGE